MMICRCPGCGTPFRVTPQQIKVRNGLVRCGECKIVFNALDQLVEEQDARPSAAASSVPLANVTASLGLPPRDEDPRDLAAHLAPLQAAQAAQTTLAEPPDTAAGIADNPQPVVTEAPEPQKPLPTANTVTRSDDLPHGLRPETRATPQANGLEEIAEQDRGPAPPFARPAPAPDDRLAESEPSPTETREAALAAGLVAPRELRTAPGYSRWAETALSKGSGPKLSGPPRSLGWLYGSIACLLALALAAQAVHQFRTEVATRWPAARPWLEQACARLGCTVGLPRQADLISIEASDLHSDPDRGGLLVLQATLRNRAAYAQALPALELTITDTEDRAVARRVLLPDEYLEAPGGDAATKDAASANTGTPATSAFQANGEIDIRLWIDARDVGAAGYRLYLFYP